jgi:uncharacterized membrane protein YfcA
MHIKFVRFPVVRATQMFVIGLMSSMMGIGGGMLLNPVLLTLGRMIEACLSLTLKFLFLTDWNLMAF